MKKLPTRETIAARLEIVDGVLVWRKTGKKAGTLDKTGRQAIKINGVVYPGSRLAWKLATGKEPRGNVKFVDGDPTNLRPENLRPSEAGRVSVSYSQAREDWVVRKDGLPVARRHDETTARNVAKKIALGQSARALRLPTILRYSGHAQAWEAIVDGLPVGTSQTKDGAREIAKEAERKALGR